MTRRKRDVQRDSFDFRDLIYRPALLELPDEFFPRWEYLHILDQESQGACTGFGLAAVVNYLLAHKRKNAPTNPQARASARMLFEMAKRYDQWPGAKYDWSSSRGAMKGWFKHGVCTEANWPNDPSKGALAHLTRERQLAALSCPLGAYYRVLSKRTDVHSALNEAGVIYAAADTHDGWDKANGKHEIAFKPGATGGGGHAFAIVGYTPKGFLVQNSWGDRWGGFQERNSRRKRDGIALWHYEDFDLNVWDLWVARTALPVESLAALRGQRYTHGTTGTRVREASPPSHEIWGHYVHIDDAQYNPTGEYPTQPTEMSDIVDRLVNGDLVDGKRQPRPDHLLLFAHGGLNSVDGAAMRVSKWRPVFKRNNIAELHFIWETGFLAELKDVLLGKDKYARERVAGVSDWWDKWIEKISQPLGYPLWYEMQSDADTAFQTLPAAGTHAISALGKALGAAGSNAPKVHLLCHSAGSIWVAHLIEQWKALGGPEIEQLILFAPACTVDLFFDKVVPVLQGPKRLIGTVHHFQLDDGREKDDNVAEIYRKSLLYLVSRSFQKKGEVVPVLGMEIYREAVEKRLAAEGVLGRVKFYDPEQNPDWTKADAHGAFDNDLATMNSMLELVLGKDPAGKRFEPEELPYY